METLTGRDSAEISDNITSETSKVDWARLLLDTNTDDMIITVSREKIAHEIIRLRNENRSLKSATTADQVSTSQLTTKISLPLNQRPLVLDQTISKDYSLSRDRIALSREQLPVFMQASNQQLSHS